MSRFVLFVTLVTFISCSSPQSEIAEVPTEPPATATTLIVEASPQPTRTPRPTWTTIPTNTPQPDTPIPPTDMPATATPTALPTETESVMTAVVPTKSAEPTTEVAAAVVDATTTAIPTTVAIVATTIVPATVIPTIQSATATNLSPTATLIAPTMTTIPTTDSPKTATSLPPTATLVAPTATHVPPTAAPTNLPPTATTVPATATSPPPPTATPLPPTATRIPATATPIPPTAVPTSSAMSIGALASLPDGQEVTITGNVVNASSFSAGFKFTIADSTGRISMVMFSNTYDDCWDKNVLNVGATVVVEGEIGRFEGELQIVPQWGGGVDVTAPAYAYAQPQTVANLPNVMGQRAMIEGEITEIDVTDSFTKIDVNDGTGVVEVFLWNNIWVRVPNKDSLAVGQRIKAVGVIGEFRGTIQLSPPLPYDIVKQ